MGFVLAARAGKPVLDIRKSLGTVIYAMYVSKDSPPFSENARMLRDCAQMSYLETHEMILLRQRHHRYRQRKSRYSQPKIKDYRSLRLYVFEKSTVHFEMLHLSRIKSSTYNYFVQKSSRSLLDYF
jgi:hypothetical protein